MIPHVVVDPRNHIADDRSHDGPSLGSHMAKKVAKTPAEDLALVRGAKEERPGSGWERKLTPFVTTAGSAPTRNQRPIRGGTTTTGCLWAVRETVVAALAFSKINSCSPRACHHGKVHGFNLPSPPSSSSAPTPLTQRLSLAPAQGLHAGSASASQRIADGIPSSSQLNRAMKGKMGLNAKYDAMQRQTEIRARALAAPRTITGISLRRLSLPSRTPPFGSPTHHHPVFANLPTPASAFRFQRSSAFHPEATPSPVRTYPAPTLWNGPQPSGDEVSAYTYAVSEEDAFPTNRMFEPGPRAEGASASKLPRPRPRPPLFHRAGNSPRLWVDQPQQLTSVPLPSRLSNASLELALTIPHDVLDQGPDPPFTLGSDPQQAPPATPTPTSRPKLEPWVAVTPEMVIPLDANRAMVGKSSPRVPLLQQQEQEQPGATASLLTLNKPFSVPFLRGPTNIAWPAVPSPSPDQRSNGAGTAPPSGSPQNTSDGVNQGTDWSLASVPLRGALPRFVDEAGHDDTRGDLESSPVRDGRPKTSWTYETNGADVMVVGER
ncbi:hypothetical protein M427DRAFT_41332 [Gonapodya prolifera JEL478]|uniref:Uncharacterized protein n=1 Tax=Gonapodya prolifera (strain JEL478) TaxID=1344416 RepID=A0A139AV83_GONPJ|nr:hypothetical protein M427DRAFT_41332 [Gonapodya prolifera JEL478]|eukprot:KXS20609.1 hypothetical protein M427DRAFT_41332 [Gonapodya prolifera JEL478]